MILPSDIGPRRGASSMSGFTLVELLVVIAILGLMLALVGVAARPVSPATHAHGAAQEISGALRAARSAALMSNRSVDFTLDLTPPGYRWGKQSSHRLPPDIKLALMVSREKFVTGSKGRIRFDPDGSSSGGRVSVSGGNQFWIVGVDWLSGRVSVLHATP
jgi:general secretion pathway protein H